MKKFIEIVSMTSMLALFAAPAFSAEGKDLFGGGGYIHPSLELTSEYSDNYNKSHSDEKSDWSWVVSPGLMVTIPSDRAVSPIMTNNGAAGGGGGSAFSEGEYVGFQGALSYRADIERHDRFDEDDRDSHNAQAAMKYSFPGGLSIELSDVYIAGYDDYDEGDNEADEFTSNLGTVIVAYRVSEKLELSASASNYQIDYDSSNDNVLEREDDQLSASVFYRVLPKTRLFLQYDHVDVDYDDDLIADSVEERVFVGVKFDATARITGHLQVGQGWVDSEQASDDDYDDFIAEAMLTYQLSERSAITLTGANGFQTSESEDYQNIEEDEIGLSLSHQFGPKLGATLWGGYKEKTFNIDSNDSDRKDEIRAAGISLQYNLQDWLGLSLAYDYTDADSNLNGESYDENLLMGKVAFSF